MDSISRVKSRRIVKHASRDRPMEDIGSTT